MSELPLESTFYDPLRSVPSNLVRGYFDAGVDGDEEDDGRKLKSPNPATFVRHVRGPCVPRWQNDNTGLRPGHGVLT